MPKFSQPVVLTTMRHYGKSDKKTDYSHIKEEHLERGHRRYGNRGAWPRGNEVEDITDPFHYTAQQRDCPTAENRYKREQGQGEKGVDDECCGWNNDEIGHEKIDRQAAEIGGYKRKSTQRRYGRQKDKLPKEAHHGMALLVRHRNNGRQPFMEGQDENHGRERQLETYVKQ